MKTPTFYQSGAASSFTAATSVNCALPASPSVKTGDIGLMRVLISSANTTITWPAGWTEIHQGQVGASFTAGLAWKRLTDTEGGTSPTINFGTSCTGTSRVATYQGCRASGTPYEGFTANNGTDTTAEASAIVTTGPDRLGVNLYLHDATGTSSTPATWTNDVTGAVNSTRNYVDSKAIPTAGTEAAVTRTHSGAAAWETYSLALIPERKYYVT